MTDYDALVIEARNYRSGRGAPLSIREVRLIGRLADAVADLAASSTAAEGYLDECVADLQNVDIATMRRILRAPLAPVPALDAGSAPGRAPLPDCAECGHPERKHHPTRTETWCIVGIATLRRCACLAYKAAS